MTNDQRYLRLRWEHDASFRRALRTLALNLSVAGGLTLAWRAGDNHGFHMGEDSSQCTCQWGPNVNGEAYVGATRCRFDDDDDYEARRAHDPDDFYADGGLPDAEIECCPRYTWGDGTHDLNCSERFGPVIPGPNGCTCGHNGDCNCRYVP